LNVLIIPRSSLIEWTKNIKSIPPFIRSFQLNFHAQLSSIHHLGFLPTRWSRSSWTIRKGSWMGCAIFSRWVWQCLRCFRCCYFRCCRIGDDSISSVRWQYIRAYWQTLCCCLCCFRRFQRDWNKFGFTINYFLYPLMVNIFLLSCETSIRHFYRRR
jgi:hypothetical protein